MIEPAYADYLARVNDEAERTARRGQRAFNVLRDMRPDLAERVRSTGVDPFYEDSRLPAFLAWVEANWRYGGSPESDGCPVRARIVAKETS